MTDIKNEAARARALRTIDDLYGAAGSDHSTEIGDRLMLETISDVGLETLSTDFLVRLAAKHLAVDMDR